MISKALSLVAEVIFNDRFMLPEILKKELFSEKKISTTAADIYRKLGVFNNEIYEELISEKNTNSPTRALEFGLSTDDYRHYEGYSDTIANRCLVAKVLDRLLFEALDVGLNKTDIYKGLDEFRHKWNSETLSMLPEWRSSKCI